MEGENFVESAQSVEAPSYDAGSSQETYAGTEGYTADSSSEGTPEGDYQGNYQESDNGTIASARSAEGQSFELYTDPVTGKTEFRVTSAQEEAGTPEEGFDDNYSDQEDVQEENGFSREVNQYVDNVTGEVAEYSVDEFAKALASGVVDERRVPQEYQSQYADFKIEQARIAFNDRIRYEQQMRDRQAQIEAAQQAEVQQQLAAMRTPEARAEINKQFYEALDSEAERFAIQDLGITQKQIDDARYDEDGGEAFMRILNDAKDWHKSRLMNELQTNYQQERAYQAQQKQLYDEIGNFAIQAEQTEPHFAEIDDMLRTAWQEMPTKYGAVVKAALDSLARGTCTQQEAQIVKKYYEDTRKLFYARANGFANANKPKQVKKKPPMVERPGNGRNVGYKPDYAALRSADVRGKKAWLADYFKDIQL